MKQKRNYIKPEIQVVELVSCTILAGSVEVIDYGVTYMESSEAEEVINSK